MNWSLVLCALLTARGVTAQEGFSTETNGITGAEVGLSQADPGDVSLCLQIHAIVPPAVLWEAELTASQIFEGIGVRLQWSCKVPVICNDVRPVLVRVQDQTPDFEPAGALAISLPFARTGVRITIFYDRFKPILEKHGGSAGLLPGVLLGHTLAHELGHVLARHDGHSKAGLMRAAWDDRDFLLMQSRPLAFTGEFGRIIRSGIAKHNLQ